MTALATHTLIELRGSLRNRQLLFLTYAFPLGFYALMGLVMTGINPAFKASMIPAMVIFAIMITTLMGLPDPIVNARDAGIFRSYKIFGVPAANVLFAPALTVNLHIVVVASIITLTAGPLFGAQVPTNALGFVLVTAVAMFTFSGLGVLIGVVSSSARVGLLWSQLIFLPSMLVSGLMIPYEMLPASAQRLALLFPTTYAMNGYTGLAYGVQPPFNTEMSLVILLAGGLLSIVLAVLMFNWDRSNRTARLHPAFGLLAMAPYVVGMLLV
ncbi:MAG: ABC transporter permease [Anaerolineae bacterium]|nr:ABC transporter permease [Anaerolineae bacterium]MCB0203430.1 ABC transporter permease [Anaerolineae bacterium]